MNPIISLCDVSWEVESHKIIHEVSFNLMPEEVLGLIGPTGSGKSVLLKLLAHVYEPSSGEVVSECERGDELSLMFQEGALFDSLSVLDNVAFPLIDGRTPCSTLPLHERRSVCEQVFEILSCVGLQDHSAKVPGQLSGGMRRRVSLARALVTRPRVALLDDPTAGLDPVASSVIMDLIVNLHSTLDTSVIIVSHDLRRLLPVCDRMIALFDGRVVFNGSVESLLDDAPQEVRTFISCRYDLDDEISDGERSDQ